MAERITAIVAYRRPGRRVFWDEGCSKRVGLMRLLDNGKIAIKTLTSWEEVETNFVFYTDHVTKKKASR